MCIEEDMSMFVNVWVTEVKSCKAADVVDDAVGELKLEIYQVEGVVGAQDGDCWLLQRANMNVEYGKTFFCAFSERVLSHAEEDKV